MNNTGSTGRAALMTGASSGILSHRMFDRIVMRMLGQTGQAEETRNG